MRNPTNVYFDTFGNKSFALYDLPGYNNKMISNHGQKKTASPEHVKQILPLAPQLSLPSPSK